MKPKLGCPSYVNVMPLLHGIKMGEVSLPAELLTQIPSELNKALAEKKIEIGLISSIEYARHHADYWLLPELCLNSLGQVMSVGLFSRCAVEQLQGKSVILSSASATSQVLLKLILRKKFLLTDVDYPQMPPDLDHMLNHGPAALLIGDEALRARCRTDLKYYDLGALWQEMTGLPFVFAVFAVRKEWAAQNREIVYEILDALKQSLAYGMAHLEEVEAEARQVLGQAPPDFSGYFKSLGYQWTEEMKQGLLLFYQYATQWQHAPECGSLEFFK